MSSRLALAVLLLPLLAVAAPVPKRKPAFGEFGDFTDPKTKCKAEVIDGALTITVPTDQPAVNPDKMSPLPPTVARTVEGDFVLTVRVKHTLPDGASTALKDSSRVAVASGLSVSGDGNEYGAMAVFLRGSDERRWWTRQVWAQQEKGGAGWSATGTGIDPDAAVYLRVLRAGDQVTFEESTDGKEWRYLRGGRVKGLTDKVRVGPVAFQCTDQEFTTTFDEYDLKPLTKEKK